jgi:hypothetical protein
MGRVALLALLLAGCTSVPESGSDMHVLQLPSCVIGCTGTVVNSPGEGDTTVSESSVKKEKE